ncbi:hypothetical protein ACWGGS_37390 [Streptomyces decoyicus]
MPGDRLEAGRERGEPLECVSGHDELLRLFFRAAADEGDAMLRWLGRRRDAVRPGRAEKPCRFPPHASS